MISNPFDDFVSADEAKMFEDATSKKRVASLLWGDGVRVTGAAEGGAAGKGRGFEGWVEKAALGGEALLEVYFIDVGQGDGTLIRRRTSATS